MRVSMQRKRLGRSSSTRRSVQHKQHSSLIANDIECDVLLTIIVPAYNEVNTLKQLLLDVVATPYHKQVIVVDDGSSDGMSALLNILSHELGVETIAHPVNCGKGTAIRSGLMRATGKYTLIQDADLEYSPSDYGALLQPLLEGHADVVFGSRYLSNHRQSRYKGIRRLLFRLGVFALNITVRMIYGVHLTDEASGYKVTSTTLLRSINLECCRFEFCSELTAKACRLGLRIAEVPVSYQARTHRQGKKIKLRDGILALYELWRWRTWKPCTANLQQNVGSGHSSFVL
jgi:dolichol-phosphate mannosyltransferase